MKSAEEQLKIIKSAAVEIIPEAKLLSKLQEKRPLRIKWGADPSAPDLHLGHTVVLRKLRQLQDLGHEIIFIVGDFTAMIGDPSGKSETRPALSREQVKTNAETYKKQVFKILDKNKTKVRFNSHWLDKLKLIDAISLAGKHTVARMLERDDFKKRFKDEQPISIHEFMYPLLQGYDSVEVKADIEIGGTDQKFNLLVGRSLQEEFGQKPQAIITMPILEGTDGKQKMSKSLGNYIGITEPPKEIFGKIMSISDELMYRYYALLTDEDLAHIKTLHPREAKEILGKMMVSRFYSQAEADKAAHEFKKVFTSGGRPDEIPKAQIKPGKHKLKDLLVEVNLVESKSEAARIIRQGGVSVNHQVVDNEHYELSVHAGEKYQIKVGKRKFVDLEAK